MFAPVRLDKSLVTETKVGEIGCAEIVDPLPVGPEAGDAESWPGAESATHVEELLRIYFYAGEIKILNALAFIIDRGPDADMADFYTKIGVPFSSRCAALVNLASSRYKSASPNHDIASKCATMNA